MQVQSITLTLKPYGYIVEHDGVDSGELSFGEMLEQIVSLTHPAIQHPRFKELTRGAWCNSEYRDHIPEDPCDDWTDQSFTLDIPF